MYDVFEDKSGSIPCGSPQQTKAPPHEVPECDLRLTYCEESSRRRSQAEGGAGVVFHPSGRQDAYGRTAGTEP